MARRKAAKQLGEKPAKPPRYLVKMDKAGKQLNQRATVTLNRRQHSRGR